MSDGLRFTSSGLPGVQFVRRPVTQLPAEGTACVVDDGHALGWCRRPVGALQEWQLDQWEGTPAAVRADILDLDRGAFRCGMNDPPISVTSIRRR